MSRIVVLGCGAVGRHMAIDLCKAPSFEVVSVDVNEEDLERLAQQHPIQTRVEDLSTVEGVTRGYTYTAVARLVLDGGYSQMGISPPEFVGRVGGCRERVEKYLEDRGVRCRMQRS